MNLDLLITQIIVLVQIIISMFCVNQIRKLEEAIFGVDDEVME